jgi:transposase
MLHPQESPSVHEETHRVACAAFPKGTLCLHIADALGPIHHDGQFVALFPRRGQPAEAPGRLALATVLQYVEGLSDRQAADAVRGRIDWKYALGLSLTDHGFDHTVLSEFRSRLIEDKPDSPELVDRLYEAGCDDALISVENGKVSVNFDREAPSKEAALQSAQADVRRAGARVLRVDPLEDLPPLP